jgi:D-alanyl-lipoteichoic acid acyltransferase DltB (MBOAT superfamily)
MTLSRFLRDYLYIPLGGARVGHARRYLNFTIVMLVGGLWHGAGVNFIIWGGLHAAYLAINHFFRDVIADRLPRSFLASNTWMQATWLLTFLAVTIAWIFFRSSNLGAATSILSAMAGLSSQAGVPAMLTSEDAIAIAIVLGGALLLPNSMDIIGFRNRVSTPSPQPVANTLRWNASWVWALFTGAIAAMSIASLSKPTPFLYFQF